MATKKTDTKKKASAKGAKATKTKAAPKKAAKRKAPAKPVGPRHPRAKVVAAHGSKGDLAKSLAGKLAHGGEDEGTVADRLRTASNSQLLRLSRVVETVQQKYGSRDKLIAAIGAAQNKGKDKDYLAKLDTFTLPHLLELARQHAARA
jgi:hypothetical protein